MGLPQYLRVIIQRYSSAVSVVPPRTGRFFIDYNGIIHNAAAACARDTPNAVTDEDVILKTLLITRELILKINPTEMVMVAIDGMPPYSKIVQQRSRRFMSVWRRKQIGEINAWDTNAITPGTRFMSKLAVRLSELNDGSLSCPVIISDSNQPGEGEAKIFDFIHNNSVVEREEHDVIFGADGDLLVRAMLCPETTKISILRDEKNNATIIDINRLKMGVEIDMGNGRHGVLDYPFLIELVGNDFIPPLTYMNKKHFAIPFLMGIYRDQVASKNKFLITIDDEGRYDIDWNAFFSILSIIGHQEDGRFPTSHEQFMSSTPNRRMSNHEKFDNFPLFHKYPGEGSIVPRSPGWRKQYYYHLLGFAQHIEERNRACVPYLQGVKWVMDYYYNRSASTGWSYPYGYSPTAIDLSSFLQTLLKQDPIEMDRLFFDVLNKKFITDDTQFQLLLVLPPQSKHLLPDCLHAIMEDPAQCCTAFYPINFKIMTYLKRYMWECHPMLPELDINLLHARFDVINEPRKRYLL
jgi:5'-3' exonuclease